MSAIPQSRMPLAPQNLQADRHFQASLHMRWDDLPTGSVHCKPNCHSQPDLRQCAYRVLLQGQHLNVVWAAPLPSKSHSCLHLLQSPDVAALVVQLSTCDSSEAPPACIM